MDEMRLLRLCIQLFGIFGVDVVAFLKRCRLLVRRVTVSGGSGGLVTILVVDCVVIMLILLVSVSQFISHKLYKYFGRSKLRTNRIQSV